MLSELLGWEGGSLTWQLPDPDCRSFVCVRRTYRRVTLLWAPAGGHGVGWGITSQRGGKAEFSAMVFICL